MEKEYSKKYWQLNRDTKIVYDELDQRPPFKVASELSDLYQSGKVAKDISALCPNMIFDQAFVVDGSVIIQDLNPQGLNNNEALNEQVRSLNEISRATIQLVDAAEQTETLIKLIKGLNLKNPLFVFPGNGATTVSEYIKNAKEKLDISNSIYVPTERILTKPGKFDLLIDTKSIPEELPKNIVIIDDVVASGQTTNTIAFRLRLNNYKANIISASWTYVYGAYLDEDYVDQTVTSLAVKGNYVKRPPINSLSCLTSPRAKYDAMKISYAQKYFENPQAFLSIIQNLTNP